jgi:hypothetical protein
MEVRGLRLSTAPICPLFKEVFRHSRDAHGGTRFLSRQGKLGEGGSLAKTETFHRDPAGSQSRPAKPGKQPETSLAWLWVTTVVKRRQ